MGPSPPLEDREAECDTQGCEQRAQFMAEDGTLLCGECLSQIVEALLGEEDLPN